MSDLKYEEIFWRMQTPCDPFSNYHDLGCGHRVKTPYSEDCGPNCKIPLHGYPLICRECAVEAARLGMNVQSLNLDEGDDEAMVDAESSEMIQDIAETEIRNLIVQGYRPTEAVPKLDPLLQFYNDMPEAQENGGFINEQSDTQPGRKFKRPGKAARLDKPSISKAPSIPQQNVPHSEQIALEEDDRTVLQEKEEGSEAVSNALTCLFLH